MTTTKTITISLSDSTNTEEVLGAGYFQIESGWVTVKTDDHKALAAYPESRVTRIKTAPGLTDMSAGWVAGVRYMAGLLGAEELLASIEETNPYA